MENLHNFLMKRPKAELLGPVSMLHTAGGERFLDIINDGMIQPTICPVFSGERLAYFFLGRPAYKTQIVYDPSYWQLPAVFILKSLPTPAVRIFPFDSGAHATSRYQERIGHISLEKYDLGTDIDIIGKLIDFYFGDFSNYKSGKSKSYAEISREVGDDVSQFVALSLAKLYNFPFNEEFDDRARLVEVQYSTPVPLTDGNLKGIIICEEWKRDQRICDRLAKFSCKVETYPILPLSSSSYYSKIYELSAGMV